MKNKKNKTFWVILISTWIVLGTIGVGSIAFRSKTLIKLAPIIFVGSFLVLGSYLLIDYRKQLKNDKFLLEEKKREELFLNCQKLIASKDNFAMSRNSLEENHGVGKDE